ATSGVVAVLTGADAVADGMRPITHSPMPGNPHEEIVRSRDVSFVPPHPAIPADRVRFPGEIVAMVIAETPAVARDAAERVIAAWDPVPPVPAGTAATEDDAPILYEQTTSNVCVDVEAGDAAAVEHAFARATHVVRLDTWVQRVTGVPMEPRAAVG